MRRLAGAGLALLALTLAACAATPRGPMAPPVGPVAPRPPPRLPTPLYDDLAALPGWDQEDHAAALAAFRRTCPVARSLDLASACRRAKALGDVSEAQARAFLEANFRPEPVGPPGLLTAYFAPVYDARRAPDALFSAPVRPRPADLPEADVNGSRDAPYADRTAIEARPTEADLAWMRPEELFFLQIQGSGVLVFEDGGRAKAVFDGVNGLPFRGVAAPMREMGLLADADSSGEAIRRWLADHRGPAADAIMRLNPRYVFFRLAPDDGLDPAGAAGVPLVAGRSLAVDLAEHALGEMFWIDAGAPALVGAFASYRRLAVALDTGGAIKGPARADLYLGKGREAGLEAGRVRHVLHLYRLVPTTP